MFVVSFSKYVLIYFVKDLELKYTILIAKYLD